MKYTYTVSTTTIWTSFDYGDVEADSREEAREKAELELKVNFRIANDALTLNPLTVGMNIDFDPSQIQIEEAKE